MFRSLTLLVSLFGVVGCASSPPAPEKIEVSVPRVTAAGEAAMAGDEAGARAQAEAALAHCRGQSECILSTHLVLAHGLIRFESYPLALEHARQSLLLSRRDGDEIVQLTSLNVLALATLLNGNIDEAGALLDEGDGLAAAFDSAHPELREETGFPMASLLEGNRALYHYANGDPASAVECQERWVPVAALKGPGTLANEVLKLAQYQAEAGRAIEARASFARARTAALESGDDELRALIDEEAALFEASLDP